MNRYAVIALAMLAPAAAAAGEEELRLTVSGPKAGCTNVAVSTKIEMIKELEKAPGERIVAKLVSGKGKDAVTVTGQVIKAKGASDAELWWVIPKLEAGEQTRWVASFEVKAKGIRGGFEWENSPGKQADLSFDGRPVLRYVCAYDVSNRARMLATYKPFHHFFGAEGKQLITSGGERGTKYPHHRGLFVGWTVGKHDLWGMAERRMPPGTAQVHRKFLTLAGGSVVAVQKSIIHWNGKEGAVAKALIEEMRTVTVYRSEPPTVLQLQLDVTLKSLAGDLELRGDVEHAGVHFRAHNDLARGDLKTAEGEWHTRVARYIFPGGRANDRALDMPWVAMNYMVKGAEYTVQMINSPGNPKGARYSANRPYGRFGVSPHEGTRLKLKAKEPLKLSYRLFVDAGPAPATETLDARHATFHVPPAVESKWIFKAPLWEE